MKKLYKLIVQSFLGPFLVTFFLTLFILVMQFFWKYVDDLMGKGLEPHVIFELLFYASANLVPMALPLAILLSSIMTFGNLGENNELTALKSAGLSLYGIMKPLTVLVFLLSLTAFFFSNNVWPVANLKFKSLLWDIVHQKPAMNIKENVFYNDIEGISILVKKKDREGGGIHDILIYDHTESVSSKSNGNQARKKIKAEDGFMRKSEDGHFLVLELFNGNIYEESQETGKETKSFPHKIYGFEHLVKKFDLSSFSMKRTDEGLFKNNEKMMNLRQLHSSIDSLKLKYSRKRTSHKKFFFNGSEILGDTTLKNMDKIRPKPFNTEELTYAVKKAVVDIAANKVRNNKNYLERHIIDLIRVEKQQINYHKIEWHRKFTLSFACLLLFFIGASLGAIAKKGGLGLPVVTSVLFFIGYYVINISMEKISENGVVSPMIGMWFSSILLTPVAILLTYKAANDTPLFSGEAYLHFFKNLNFGKKGKPNKGTSTLS